MTKKIALIKRKIKSYSKIAFSVVVVAALIIACLSSIIADKKKNHRDVGRMVALTPLYDEPAMAPRYAKVPYTALNLTETAKETEGYMNDNVGAYSDDKQLTEQEKKDKAALEALLASTDRSSISEAAKSRKEKYKKNKITAINSNTNITLTPNSNNTGSYSNSAVGTPIYATGGTYQGRFLITAYCPCAICCGKTNGITANGSLAKSNHTIAADSRYAFGTKLVIFGQVYTVEDRGGAITGNHIDIFFNTHSEALQFGTKYADVYLYDGTNGTINNNNVPANSGGNNSSGDNSGTSDNNNSGTSDNNDSDNNDSGDSGESGSSDSSGDNNSNDSTDSSK